MEKRVYIDFTLILYKARRKDTGGWVVGSFVHKKRKGESFHIIDQETNDWYEVYRESLHRFNQYASAEGEWETV